MNNLNQYIQEKLKVNSKSKIQNYQYFPKDSDELRKIIEKQLEKDKDADLNDIDVSNIDRLGLWFGGGLFEGLNPHNIKIDKWDVSNATIMSQMFYNCKYFNCDLSNWNVSNVEDMSGMFLGCENFEGKGLENWNLKNDVDMKFMFDKCESLINKPSWYHE